MLPILSGWSPTLAKLVRLTRNVEDVEKGRASHLQKRPPYLALKRRSNRETIWGHLIWTILSSFREAFPDVWCKRLKKMVAEEYSMDSPRHPSGSGSGLGDLSTEETVTITGVSASRIWGRQDSGLPVPRSFSRLRVKMGARFIPPILTATR